VPEVLVRARGLTKRFGSFTTVDGINFDLFRGEAFGFLGPNGAGKSSTMRMLGCISPPTSGYLTILGGDPVRDGPAIRSRLGVVPQEDTLDNELTVRENLLVYGRYFGLPRKLINERTDQLLDFVQLTEHTDDQVDPLSGGMKRRLTIARSLINDPDILILDEPGWGHPEGQRASGRGTLPGDDYVTSPWALLALPGAALISFATAALGVFLTTYMKSWQDLDYVLLVSAPLFLFSGTFYPLSVYPRVIAVIVEWTPLYQGVVILRDLVLGAPSPDLAWRAAYLVALGVAGLALAGQRIARLLLV
jgi:ABC-type lipoprotein export system ATPase subunit